MPESERIRVLVVDDDPDDQFLVASVLRRALPELSVEVVEALNYEAAEALLCRADAHNFDLLLFDYQLGVRTGLELLEGIRALRLPAPVIFLTGQGDEQIAVRAMKAGASDYLVKSKLSESTLRLSVRYARNLHKKELLLRKAQADQRASEAEYRRLFESARDAALLVGRRDGRILEANSSALLLYGYSREELVGEPLKRLCAERENCPLHSLGEADSGDLHEMESLHVCRDGTTLRVEARASQVEYRGDPAWLVMVRDVTERSRAAREISRLNRALHALSRCNHALIASFDEDDLYAEICRIVVEVGGYQLAWVAIAQHDEEKAVLPIASYGARQYLDDVRVTWEDCPLGNGPVGRAIRLRRPQVLRTVDDVPEFDEWRENARRHDLRAVVALPLALEPGGEAFGALAIYSSLEFAFDGEELELLTELADNLAYGVRNLRGTRALHESEERFQLVSRATKECIWDNDLVRGVLWVNQAMAESFGTANLTHEMWIEAVHPDDRERMLQELNDSIRERSNFAAEYRLKMRGEYRCVFDRGYIVRDAGGRPLRAIGALMDMTERVGAEERVRESERRYRTLFERNLAGVFRTTTAGELLDYNEAFQKVFGYSDEELRANGIAALYANPKEREEVLTRLLAEGEVRNLELRFVRKDGSTGWVLVSLSLLTDEGGVPLSIEGTLVDITERHSLFDQLLQSQKLDALGKLAGGVAHDFNNLLMVISSYAELTLEHVAGDSRLQRFAQEIHKAAKRGAGLTSQLLAFSRKQSHSLQVIDLNHSLADIGKILPRLIGEHIRVQVSPGEQGGAVLADPLQVEQVIMNLALNARDAMPQGGTLSIQTSVLTVDAANGRQHPQVPAGEYVVLAVSDTGVGIDPAIQHRIFEPFFTTKERGKGTGLGLSTVYGIVQQHGAHLGLESAPGKGTSFRVYFPRTRQQLSGAAKPESGTNAGKGEIVLLVEDEDAVRTAAAQFLKARGYCVLAARCGEEALRISGETARVDLLLTDVVMPGMSGPELAGRLVQLRPDLRVVYMSGYMDSTLAEHGMDVNGLFLQKPFTLAALAGKLKEAFGAPRTVAAAAGHAKA